MANRLALFSFALLAMAVALTGKSAFAASAPVSGASDTKTAVTPKATPRAAMPASPNATVYCVTTGGGQTGAPCSNDPAYTSIQEAIDDASAGDEIRIANGSYPSGSTATFSVNKNLLITGGYSGGTNGWTTINDPNATRVNGGFSVASGTNVSIGNLVIAGGGIANSGVAQVPAAYTLFLADGGTVSGAFTLNTGARFGYESGSHVINNAQFSGAGFLTIDNATVFINGTVSATRLQLNSGTLGGDNPGVLNIPNGGVFNWNSGTHGGTGTTNIASGATVNIGGISAGHVLQQRAFNNNGVVNMNGTGNGGFYLSNGVVFNNGTSAGSSAQFNIQNDDSLTYSDGVGSVFNNNGLIRKSGGSNTSVFGNGFIQLNNNGAVRVESGVLSLDGESTDTGPSVYSALSGGRLRFNGKTHSIGPSSSVNIAGTIEFASGSVNVAGTYTVTGTQLLTGGNVDYSAPASITTLTINTNDPNKFVLNDTVNVGTLTWIQGTIDSDTAGTINVSNAINFTGVQTSKTLSRVTINNSGIANMVTTGVGALFLSNGAVFNNNNQFNINNNDSVVYGGGALPTFNNNSGAIVRKNQGTGVSSLSSGFMQFNNGGTVNVVTGTLSLDGGAAPGNVNTHTGVFNITVGATLRFGGGNGGSVNQLLSSSHVVGAGNVDINEGIMTISGEYNIGGSTNFTGGGTANFDAATATSNSVNLNSGSLSGSGLLKVNLNFNWTGGTMTSEPGVRAITELGPNGTLNLTGVNSGKSLIRRVFNNYGSAFMKTTGSGSLQLGDNAEFNNYNRFNITNNDSIVYSGGTQSNFNNYKTFLKSGGAGVSTIGNGNLAFNNQTSSFGPASVEVVTGTLSLDGGGVDTGSFAVDVSQGSAVLRFNGGIHTLQNGSAVTGPGDVEFSSGVANFAGVYNVTGATNITGGTANFNHQVNAQARTLNLRQGTLAGDGAIAVTQLLDWTGGVMDGAGGDVSTTNVASGATLYIRGVSATKVLVSRTLNNNGTAFMNGTGTGALLLGNGASFNNNGSLDIQNDDSILYQGGTAAHIRNAGTLVKSAGPNITTLGNNQLDFNNTGAVTVVTGTISLDGGGTDTGSFTVNVNQGSARLRFNGGTHTLQNGSAITGPGDVEFSGGVANLSGSYNITGKTNVTGGTVGFNQGVNAAATLVNFTNGVITGNGSFNVPAGGVFNWTGGVMDGSGAITSTTTIAAGATLNLGGVGSPKTLSARTLNNNGSTVMNGSGVGVLYIGNGAYFNNAQSGSFTIQNDDNVVFNGGTAAVFNNNGLFQKAAGGGVSTVGADRLSFNNTGTIRVNSGVINFAANFNQNGDGKTYLNGGDLLTQTVLEFAGGSLSGTGAITGTVSNSGAVFAPSGTTSNSSPTGLITINGDYSQGGSGAIEIGIGGNTPVVQYDQVSVLRSATLSGTLSLNLLSYTPNVGDTFRPVTYASRNNNSYFGTISGQNFNGRSFQVDYETSGVKLTVVSGSATPTPIGGPGTPTATPTGGPVTPTPTLAPGDCATSFSDVTSSNPFYSFVHYLACKGIISGYSDGTFRPGANTTRGQLAKIVVNAMGWSLVQPQRPTFNDVSASNAFYSFIETAYSHGVISGYADGTFRWGANVTRGQLSKIVVAAKGWTQICPATSSFSDVSGTNPFYCYVETAASHQIISGYDIGNGQREFRPGNNATRGQIAKIVDLAITQ